MKRHAHIQSLVFLCIILTILLMGCEDCSYHPPESAYQTATALVAYYQTQNAQNFTLTPALYHGCETMAATFKTLVAANPQLTNDAVTYNALSTMMAPKYCDYWMLTQTVYPPAPAAPPPPPPPEGTTTSVPMMLIVTRTITPFCLAAPALVDSLGGTPTPATTLVLEWRSDYILKSNEMFAVFASPNLGELTALQACGDSKLRIATTTDKKVAIDLTNWNYAGTYDKFYWMVRIVNRDGACLDCAGQPGTFVLSPLREKPGKEVSPPNEPPVREQPAGPPVFHR